MKRYEGVKLVEIYEYNTEYCIDIIEIGEIYESWLYRRDYGFKIFMFGLPTGQQSKEEFMDIVIRNVPEYIPNYCHELEALENNNSLV